MGRFYDWASVKLGTGLEKSPKFAQIFQLKKINIRMPLLFLALFLIPLVGLFVFLNDASLTLLTIDISTNVTEQVRMGIFLISTGLFMLVFCFILFTLRFVKNLNAPQMKIVGLNNKILALLAIGLAVAAPLTTNLIQGYNSNFANGYKSKVGPFLHFGPYTDKVADSSANSMVVWWFEPEETSTTRTLKYGTSIDPNSMTEVSEIAALSDGKRHEVHLTGLTAGTKYYYHVPGFSDLMYNFTTGPDLGSSDAFRFVSVGDTRNGGGTSVSMYGDLNRAIDGFYAGLNEEPAFVLNLGDINSQGPDLESWEVFFDDAEDHASRYPYMTAIGNHEWGGDKGANFDYLMGHDQYYSHDYGNAHFIYLNTYDNPDVPYAASSDEQYEWVKADLAANAGDKWTVVNFHVPFLTTEARREYLKYQYYDLFRDYEVDLVLTAHDHHYDSFYVDEDRDYNGTIYVVNGGGGAEIDAYMMTTWEGEWSVNASSDFMVDQPLYNQETYRMGEVAWGFVDVQISGDQLDVNYYRWLSFPKYMEITGQTIDTSSYMNYEMRALSESDWDTYDLANVELVETISKTRSFV